MTRALAERERRFANRPLVTPSVSPVSLRPLGVGELLDRAVTLCVRYVVPFSLIGIAYGIPFGIVNYFATRRNALLIQTLADAFRTNASGKTVDPNAMATAFGSTSLNDVWWSLALIGMIFFFAPLATAAMIDAVAESYLGRGATFGRAYRVGFARWFPMIGINVLYGVAGSIVYTVAVLAFLAIAFALVALTAYARVVGIVFDVTIGIAAIVAILGCVTIVLLMLNVSYVTCVVEGAGLITSFTRGIGRIANRAGFKRAAIVGLAYLAVTIGIGIVSLVGQATLDGFLRSAVAGAVFSTVISVATAAFLSAFMTIFYYDLRVREDGLDLQMAARAALDVQPQA